MQWLLTECANWRTHFDTRPTSQWRCSSHHSPALRAAKWSTASPSLFNVWQRMPHYPQNSRVGGPQSWSGRFGEELTFGHADSRTSDPRAQTVGCGKVSRGIEFRLTAEERFVSPYQRHRNQLCDLPSLLFSSYWVSFRGVRRPGLHADHLPRLVPLLQMYRLYLCCWVYHRGFHNVSFTCYRLQILFMLQQG
jgi:hypothetical protein